MPRLVEAAASGGPAGGRKLEEWALELAVTASVRHRDTAYDKLLMAGVARSEARERVADDVAGIIATWRSRQGQRRGAGRHAE